MSEPPSNRDDEAPTRDHGGSILELIICVTVMGLIATVLLAVTSTVLRNDTAAARRMDESRDLQQISSYLPLDVSSAFLDELVRDTDTGDGYLDAVLPSTPAVCPGDTTGGTNALTLKWSETFGGTLTHYRVQYRIQVADADTRLVRVSCEGATLGSLAAKTVARELRASNPVTVVVNGAVVRLTLHQKSGRTLTVSSTTQNPHADLDPINGFDD